MQTPFLQSEWCRLNCQHGQCFLNRHRGLIKYSSGIILKNAFPRIPRPLVSFCNLHLWLWKVNKLWWVNCIIFYCLPTATAVALGCFYRWFWSLHNFLLFLSLGINQALSFVYFSRILPSQGWFGRWIWPCSPFFICTCCHQVFSLHCCCQVWSIRL